MENDTTGFNEQEPAQEEGQVSSPADTGDEEQKSSAADDSSNEETQQPRRTRPRRSKGNSQARVLTDLTNQVADLKRTLEGSSNADTALATPPPKQEDFADFEEFQRKSAEWQKNQIVRGLEKRMQEKMDRAFEENRRKTEGDAVKRSLTTRFEAQMSSLQDRPDYAKIRANLMPKDGETQGLTYDMFEVIARRRNSADILAELGSNPHLLDELAEASQVDAMELGSRVGEISASLGKRKRSSSAPPPNGQISSGLPADGKKTDLQKFLDSRQGKSAPIISMKDWEKMGVKATI